MGKVKSKNIIIAIALLSVVLFGSVCGLSVSQPAHADIGPKPSVTVTVENIGDKVCYGTLLSASEGYGPHHAYTSEYPYIQDSRYDPENKDYDSEEYAIWKAFVDYVDPDGYYYWQTHWALQETDKIFWGYYRPYKFKILLYFPETQTFASSDICECYAFHSYFNAKLSDNDIAVSQDKAVTVRKNYDYTWEIVSLFARIVATVALELGVAWLLFKMRTKKKIITVTVVNVITQTIMNVAINVLSYFEGGWAILWYIPIELGVFVVEAVAYSIIFRVKERKTIGAYGAMPNPDYASIGKCVLLSFVANLFSFVVGVALALVIPGIF